MNSRFARVKTDLLESDSDLGQRLTQVLGAPTDPVHLVERRARELLPHQRAIVWEGDVELTLAANKSWFSARSIGPLNTSVQPVSAATARKTSVTSPL